MKAPRLPSQLVDPMAGAFLPERKLAVAVLAVAFADYQTYATMKDDLWSRRRFAEVRQWFMSDTTRWPFSFVNICEALKLDTSAIRAGVRTSQRRPGPIASYGRGRLLRE